MPPSIKNSGLEVICQKLQCTTEHIAGHLRVNRSSIYRYVNGKSAARLEQRLAALAEISVPELRRLVGLNPRPASAPEVQP